MSRLQTWLGAEAEAARLLLAELTAAGHGDDEQLLADSVEGETSFLECIDKALEEIDERTAMMEAIHARVIALENRQDRIKASVDRIRDAIATALEASGVKLPLRLPTATLSISTRQGNLHIDEEVLPIEYTATRVLKSADRGAIDEALKAGIEVPGVTRGNSTRILTIRR